jgi:hypothetical protein
VQHTVFEFVAGAVVKEVWLEFTLFGSQHIELGLDHGSVNVKVAAFVDLDFAVVLKGAVFAVTCPHRQTLLMSGKQSSPTVRQLVVCTRIARCGPACRVVWQGRLRKSRPPYADLNTDSNRPGAGVSHPTIQMVGGWI